MYRIASNYDQDVYFFPAILTLATKQDRYLLIEDLYIIYNLIPAMDFDKSWWLMEHLRAFNFVI